jgi:cyclic beta-1,2-glucan synthetase
VLNVGPAGPACCFIEPVCDDLIRRDLHGPEHLEAVARELAEASALAPAGRRGQPLLRHCGQIERQLKHTYRQIRTAVERHEIIGPETEWLLDNFHIIEESLREVRHDLPQGYYTKLPKLASGPLAGYPRVYALGLSLIAHTDSSLDEDHILRFVQAYQSVTPLTTGELWAIPIMLRLGLLENLRRLAQQILRAWEDREEAMELMAGLHRFVEEHLRSAQPLTDEKAWQLFLQLPELSLRDPFLVHLLQLVRDHPTLSKVGIEWLEQHLGRHGSDTDQVLRRESQRQAVNQVCVGNCVTSLRLLSALDWPMFFEKVSLVERVLRQDPAAIYPRQDFATRDRYRRVVEQLARGSTMLEQDVAARAIELAPGCPSRHVGHYLLGKGRAELAAAVNYSPTWGDRFFDGVLNNPHLVYFGGIVLVLAALLGALLAAAAFWSAGTGTLILLAVVALLPASELAVGLVNYLLTVLLPPRVLPKMDFKDGVPPEFATCVVMPTLLTRADSAAHLVERLELHYLANPDPHLCFALLTDFTDAPAEHMPTDDAALQAALDGIRRLNEDYCAGGSERFFLFHRKRLWNPSEGCWMGWERKRGKLAEFNRLLRGDTETSINVRSGTLPFPIRFVITLDMDTQLPRETAVRLIGALAHPLNQARFDPVADRVVEGYAVLQPRVSICLPAAVRSLFARIYVTSAGIDPYTNAISDVYQDLFGAGSYTGKGIYDVDAFEPAVGKRFAANTILSHDLVEGNFARCGLVTDIQLLDDFPSRFHVFVRREHRWARGDWQLLPWLFSANPLPVLERWKIFDNLRRTLVPVGLLALFVIGWTILPGPAWLWTAAALLVPTWPLLLLCVDRLRMLVLGRPLLTTVREWQADVPASAGQACLSLVFLVDQARLMLDAVVRTLWRLIVSHRRLLEWETAASTEQRLGCSFIHFYRTMWPTVLLALVIGGAVLVENLAALPAAALPLGAWLASPLVAFWVSRPRPTGEAGLSPADRGELRRWARKTWHFFDTFVGSEDHFLPPDNFQEDPEGKVAHRTSPTNIGLMLLSTLAARDFGYLSLGRLVERLEKTFETLEQLERSRGHFHNWYDTVTLKSLQPVYISTVDSGNLLGCLLTLKQGLLEVCRQPLVSAALRDGLADTLGLARLALVRLTPQGKTWNSKRGSVPSESGDSDLRLLADELDALEHRLAELPGEFGDWPAWLAGLESQAAALQNRAQKLTGQLRERPNALLLWVQSFLDQVSALGAELAESTVEGSVREPINPPLARRCEALAARAGKLAADMDFSVLYNEQRHLFAVGYNLTLGRLDNANYDLLASEASLTSFLVIARGEAPRRHWFQLGRPLTRVAGQVALVSWGGTMFEYLMPPLLLTVLPETLLSDSMRAAVDRQIEYGRQRRVPWGMSESGYSTLDAALDYQYQSFGVPGLGLRRGLGQDLVIAPYATMLALRVRPVQAAANLRRLVEEQAEGPYGFYEAIDYTPSRLPPNQRSLVVRSYMAHHQGMSLIALANQLLNAPMPRRFHAEPMVRATELLMQERMPRGAPTLEVLVAETPAMAAPREVAMPLSRRLTTPYTPHPRTHLLSNGQYTVMVTNAGGSWSWCTRQTVDGGGHPVKSQIDVTRWREDSARDQWGQFCYLRDLRSGKLWSAGHQPLGVPADFFEVLFSPDKVEFHRVDGTMETHLEVTVSPEHNCELRRLTLTNHDNRPHDLEVTSYAEPVLAPHGADLAHPAFGKLFLETESHPEVGALLCWRRPRTAEEKALWSIHVLAVEGATLGELQCETDRARFLGRGRTPANPQALDGGAGLSGETGAVLDPVFSLRQRLRVPAGGSVNVAFTTAVADSREDALVLADTYHDYHSVGRAFELAWAHSQVEMQQQHLTTEDVHLFQRLAAHLLYSGPFLRAAPAILAGNHQGQPALWRHGISGDKPIILVRIADQEEVLLVRQLLLAHTYWRLKGFDVDLVILNQHSGGYFEEIQQQLLTLARTSDPHVVFDRPGGIFLRKAEHFSPEDQQLLEAAARVVLDGSDGLLGGQLDEREVQAEDTTLRAMERDLQGTRPRPPRRTPLAPPRPPETLQFPNGYGGFSGDGKEYVIAPPGPGGPAVVTPAPWINVVANPHCGFLVSERAAGYTWACNSQANRLTPWNNDPVTDPPGEMIYLRDETSGAVWSLTGVAQAECRHGQGFSVFRQTANGIASELLMLVPLEDPLKLLRVTLRNPGKQPRRLSVTFYAEWVLGTWRDQAPMQVHCEVDPESEALLARNPFNADFSGRVAFADVNLRPRTLTADRTEFLGRNGRVEAPAALARSGLSGRVEAGLDPCAVLQIVIELPAGKAKEVVFLLGEAGDAAEARRLVNRYRESGQIDSTLALVKKRWEEVLTTVQVRTPNAALDLLLNRWLLYQTLSCRLWGRSAFYQSGGAYGFRDQLQDVMALVHAVPEEARRHILRAAGRQFVEGDVQHWWHPPSGRGVRTRFSDDYLWLPYVVCQYVTATGDTALLDERVSFLQASPLRPDQEEDYGLPHPASETGTIYEHCVRSIQHGLRFGPHGLPLMGTGDWNDGMNHVGAGGMGETVWGGWFLLTILDRFADLAQRRGDEERAQRFRHEADQLHRAIEEHAWDGRWYRRAYFDDGTPLGSASNTECQIDSLVQTWAVLSGRADGHRAREAMTWVAKLLVKERDGLILLFTPPFDKGPLQPGYIKGYVPGIRENGGQYTHAAAWVVLARALLGEGTRAMSLFDMLNPILHTATPKDVERFRVEPYVAVADVYSAPPHTGRGGWTWYTGSSGWLYRVALEAILGFRVQGDRLVMDPCIPGTFREYEITYRYRQTVYLIRVENPNGVERGVKTVEVDGVEQEPKEVRLVDDGLSHAVKVVLG